MNARIGVAESNKVVEFEVDDAAQFRRELEEVFASAQEVFWITDQKKRSVGVPVARIAFIEIDSEDGARTVGFSPGT